MKRILLAGLLLGMVIALVGCSEIMWLLEGGEGDIFNPITMGDATHIIVEYTVEVSKASASGTYDSYHRASIGSSFPDEGMYPDINYDATTRTYTVLLGTAGSQPHLSLTVTLSEDGETITHVRAHREWRNRIDTIEATNLSLDTSEPGPNDPPDFYGDDYHVYRARGGAACAAIQSLVGRDNGAIPEPNWVTSYWCIGMSYLEVAIRTE